MNTKAPKNFSNNLYIWSSNTIFKRCDLKKRFKMLKASNRLPKHVKFGVFKLHMGLIINHLTHKLDKDLLTQISCRELQAISTSYLYRVCIDVLKESKVLFICSSQGRESYAVGEFCKKYRFNITEYALMNDKPVKIPVVDHRMKKKVIEDVKTLQVSKHLKELFIMEYVSINIYSKKPHKGKLNLKKIHDNDVIYHNCIRFKGFVTKRNKKMTEMQRKVIYYINIMKFTPFRVKFSNISSISFYQIAELFTFLKNFWYNKGQSRWSCRQLIIHHGGRIKFEYNLSEFEYDEDFVLRGQCD